MQLPKFTKILALPLPRIVTKPVSLTVATSVLLLVNVASSITLVEFEGYLFIILICTLLL